MLRILPLIAFLIFCQSNQSFAWVEPQEGQSISAPLNTSSQTQTKQGDLNIQGKLRLDQNKKLEVGNSYLSSGGDYMHLANNEWYDGAKWNATDKGTLLQFVGQTLNIYKHDASGNHTNLMSVDSSGNLKTSGQLYTNNYGVLPNGWSGIHTQNLHARDAVRANYLCLGGGANGDAAGDCRNRWPVTSWWNWNVITYYRCTGCINPGAQNSKFIKTAQARALCLWSCPHGYWQLYFQTTTGINIKLLEVETTNYGCVHIGLCS